MPRGITLSQLLDDLRAELRQVTNVNAGLTTRDALVRRLQAAQQFMFNKFFFPHVRRLEYKNVAAGSRYYDIPTPFAFERVVEIRHKWNGFWGEPLTKGVGAEQYNAYDSTVDVRFDPVQRFDIRDTGSVAQIELWPMPATNVTSGLLFVGKRALLPLNADSDVCDLDSEILIRWAKADYLQKTDADEATRVRAEAQVLIDAIVGANMGKKKRYSFADSHEPPDPRDKILVTYAR